MVWHEMKNYVRDRFCKTPEEVSTAIEDFRKSLTIEKLKNYIMKIKEVKLNHKIVYTKYKKNLNFLKGN